MLRNLFVLCLGTQRKVSVGINHGGHQRIHQIIVQAYLIQELLILGKHPRRYRIRGAKGELQEVFSLLLRGLR